MLNFEGGIRAQFLRSHFIVRGTVNKKCPWRSTQRTIPSLEENTKLSEKNDKLLKLSTSYCEIMLPQMED